MGISTALAETGQHRSHYKALNVLPSSDFDVVERAYWHLAYKYSSNADPGSKAKLAELNEAMAAISAARVTSGVKDRPLANRLQSYRLMPAWQQFIAGPVIDVWLFAFVIAAVVLGIALFDLWVGLGELSERLATWRDSAIFISAATLAGLTASSGITGCILVFSSLRKARLAKHGDRRKDYYSSLQLDPDADSELVDLAFECLSQKYASLISENPHAAAALRELEEAYNIVGDPQRRAGYDAQYRRQFSSTVVKVEPTSSAVHAPQMEAFEEQRMQPPIPSVTPPDQDHAVGGSVESSAMPAGHWHFARVMGVVLWNVLLKISHVIYLILANGIVFILIAGYYLLMIAAVVGAKLTAFALDAGSQTAQGKSIQLDWKIVVPRLKSSKELVETEVDGSFLQRIHQLRTIERESAAPMKEDRGDMAESVATDEAAEDAGPIAARLLVIEGALMGRAFFLRTNTSATLGSSPHCDIVLPAEHGEIAAEQARIWPREGKFMFHSLSPDLTAMVQGKPLVWLVLADGDIIEVGAYKLRFEAMLQDL